jgi:glycosyltransferase involved in cell wall biosynthesis
MKNIVLLSGNRIAPAATGGQVRSLGIARALARLGHSVHIFSTAGRKQDYRPSNLRRGVTMEVEIEPGLKESTHLGPTFGMMQTAARRLDYPRVWQHHMLAHGLVPGRLRSALSKADIVFSDLPYCPPVPGPWRRQPWFLISHNLEHKLLEQGSPRQRRFADWMRRIESEAPQTYTDILACAEEDKQFFQAHDIHAKLTLPIVRCGVDPHCYALSPHERPQIRGQLGLSEKDWVLVFSGSGFGPNVEALRQIEAFCAAEADFMAKHRAHILVIGSVCRQAYRRDGLIVTGPVPEVLPYLAASDAGINLVTRGSGSNVKLFEYLAAKLPVISTGFGVRGTNLVAFEDYLPCSRDNLKEVIHRFVSVDRETWKSRAQDVWNRHRDSCDIHHLVSSAISALPAFNA